MTDGDQGIFASLPPIRELAIGDAATLDRTLREANEPFVVRGLVADWPIVRAGQESARRARDYIARHAQPKPFAVSVVNPRSGGRLFYDDAEGMNFQTAHAGLAQIFARIDADEGVPDTPPIYLASVNMQEFFIGLHEANHVDLGDRKPLASIWMGTRTRIAAHNDVADNLACVAVGERRFTLFPRDQFRNLYLGPVDDTPAGRPISMVDFHNPDFARFPRFREALAHAQVCVLGAGDALYIPTMWWHHVEGLAAFNVLVNYWWRDSPRWLTQPQDALSHAMLAIRDLPDDERRHWRDMFDHYVFAAGPDVTEHIPEHQRGVLATLTAESAERIRAVLARAFGR
ncbi:cupin-like domain-containing protein [Sphingomonas sp. KR1UV-12]|uniref:Cupin-like domain-containing protein n=1 Tax=Sphingomonas aurea TaxID=3063994 RepID=A0ABT9EHN5_9SPHN|nr:cupin-like domain-containing protein [Sphingomonas sp. KR1UV-12]MDP1026481.1 cupin-like domain-containing protein [Sphingomonas sp. KR1UV-12]